MNLKNLRVQGELQTRMNALCFLAALAVTAIPLLAEEIEAGAITWMGKTYLESVVTKVTADTVSFRSKQGSFEMPWKAVPWSLQSRLKLQHEAAATSAEVEVQADDLRSTLKNLGAVTIIGKVSQVATDGLLVDASSLQEASKVSVFASKEAVALPVAQSPERIPDSTILLTRHPARLVNDNPIAVVAFPTGETFQYAVASGETKTVRVYTVIPERPRSDQSAEDPSGSPRPETFFGTQEQP